MTTTIYVEDDRLVLQLGERESECEPLTKEEAAIALERCFAGEREMQQARTHA